jgi:hypothetical protein
VLDRVKGKRNILHAINRGKANSILLLLVVPGAADAAGCTAACRLIVLTLLWKFPLTLPGAPTSTPTRETSSRERGNCGREITGTFVDNGDFHVIVGIFYKSATLDGQLYFPSEGRHAEDFFSP